MNKWIRYKQNEIKVVLKQRKKKKAPDLEYVDMEIRKYFSNAVLESLKNFYQNRYYEVR